MSSTALEKPPILIVDDSKLMRAALNKMLREDYSVHEAGDGQEAWNLLRNGCSVELVFTDLSMPVLDGFGLIKEIRGSDNEAIRNLPIVVITGAEEDDKVREQALEMGATEFVTKPFKSTQIKARAQNLVGSRRAVEEVKQAAQEQVKAVELAADQRVKEAQVLAEESIRAVEEKVEERVQQAEKEAVQQVFVDAHTHLSNPAYFQQRGIEEISEAIRHKSDLALLCVRVNHFARLSEDAQQATNSLIGLQLKQCKRQEDCATWGEEGLFYLLMPNTALEGAHQLSERILKMLEVQEELKEHWGGGQEVYSGLTLLTPRSEPTLAHLMSTADQCSGFAVQAGDSHLLVSSEAEEYHKSILAEQEQIRAEALHVQQEAEAKAQAEILAKAKLAEQARLAAEAQARAEVESRRQQFVEQERVQREAQAKLEAERAHKEQEEQARRLQEAASRAASIADAKKDSLISGDSARRAAEEAKPFIGSTPIPDQVEEKEKKEIERLRESFREDQRLRELDRQPAYAFPMNLFMSIALPFLILIHKIKGRDPEEIERIKSRLRK